jgi:hypothetical protein
MSDPYPEVRDDESGIVPPQSGRNPDWPKKIRTLTAAELDRLTIDSSGRFYWDGKLVNYEPAQQKPPERTEDKRVEPLNPAAFEVLDRAAQELRNGKTVEAIEAVPVGQDNTPSNEPQRSRAGDLSAVDLDIHREVAPQVPLTADEKSEDRTPIVAPAAAVRASDRVRVRLSFWQSLAALITVLSLAFGASGLAAYGFVAAHDWGCRTKLVESYCPQAPAPRPAPTRPDIPA